MVSRLFSTACTRSLCRFSLRGFLIAVMLASIGFITWWRWPVLLDRLPPELGPVKPDVLFCATGYDPNALWKEELKVEGKQITGGPVYAATGKCWGRRDWQQGWILEGPAEIFTKENKRIIRAEFASGKLHGPFCSWFTDGRVRETGAYFRGAKHGVWKHFERGGEPDLAEYDRGKKVGMWVLWGDRFHYQNDKLVRTETRDDTHVGDWKVSEFDANENLLRTVHWNVDHTRNLGEELFSGGKRHGDWHGVRREINLVDESQTRQFVRRGQWMNGLPDGKWIYELAGGGTRRFEFRQGVLLKIDNERMHDYVMQRFTGNPAVAQQLKYAVDPFEHIAPATRLELLQRLPAFNWCPLCVDPRLKLKQVELDALLSADLPSDFECQDLPEVTTLCVAFHDAGYCFDFRLGALWLTTPELVATWKDETRFHDWFHDMMSVAKRYEVIDKYGRERQVDGPYRRFEHYFGEINDFNFAWQEIHVAELKNPLVGRWGNASKLDGNFPAGVSAVQFPDGVTDGNFSTMPLEDRLPVELEMCNCRLVLRGDTLVIEPR